VRCQGREIDGERKETVGGGGSNVNPPDGRCTGIRRGDKTEKAPQSRRFQKRIMTLLHSVKREGKRGGQGKKGMAMRKGKYRQDGRRAGTKEGWGKIVELRVVGSGTRWGTISRAGGNEQVQERLVTPRIVIKTSRPRGKARKSRQERADHRRTEEKKD